MGKKVGIKGLQPDVPLGDGHYFMNELAEFLKNERLSCNLTVEALSGLSGISVSMFESFESCDFERFGASVLLRNIIRAYCDALHIEPDPLLRKYGAQIEACNIQDAGIKRYGRLQKTLYKRRRMVALPLLVFFLASAAVFYGGQWISKRRSKLYAPPNANRIFPQENLPVELQQLSASGASPTGAKPAPKPVTTGQATGKAVAEQKATASAGAAAMIDNNQAKAPEEASPPGGTSTGASAPPVKTAQIPTVASGETGETSKTAADPGATGNSAEVSPGFMSGDEKGALTQFSPGGSAEELAGEGPVQNAEARTLNRFTVNAEDRVWIQVKIDGQKSRSELLQSGDHREWVAVKSLEVVIGNAGGVRMKWNDNPLKAPHDVGRVLRFRLPDYAKAEQG